MNLTSQTLLSEKKIFFLIFFLFFLTFVFTNDGHRSTFDEDVAHRQTIRIITQEVPDSYVEGESKVYFDYPELFTPSMLTGPVCKNAILCTNTFIGHSITQIPFILVNDFFKIIDDQTVVLTLDDFTDQHYVWWRNIQDPNFTFVEVFYGSIFSAFSISLFFLIVRTFGISLKNSILVSLIFGFSTPIWAYSQTSLNVVPMMTFILMGYLFFRKFQNIPNYRTLIISTSVLGFAYLIRPDAIFFIIPLFVIFLFYVIKHNKKFQNFLSFVIPLSFFYFFDKFIDYIRIGTSASSGIMSSAAGISSTFGVSFSSLIGISGLLFSPGVGLFIFSPILLTAFFSFPIIYKKDKISCLLFISVFIYFLIHYGSGIHWHGLVSWGARYLLPTIPFLLIPLSFSLEKYSNNYFKIILIVLFAFGFLANFSYVVQDVNWFIWGHMGDSERGLYSLAKNQEFPLRIHPAIIWTFEYSPLTHSISNLWLNLQPDIYLLKFFGTQLYYIILSVTMIPLFYYLVKLLYSQRK